MAHAKKRSSTQYWYHIFRNRIMAIKLDHKDHDSKLDLKTCRIFLQKHKHWEKKIHAKFEFPLLKLYFQYKNEKKNDVSTESDSSNMMWTLFHSFMIFVKRFDKNNIDTSFKIKAARNIFFLNIRSTNSFRIWCKTENLLK